MPIDVRWLNSDQKFIFVHFVDEHLENWEEYNEAVDRAWELANSVDDPVVALFASYSTQMPVGSPVPHLQRAVSSMPSNVVFAVSITERTFEKMMVDLIAQSRLNEQIRTVSSWDAANKVLKVEGLSPIPLEDVPIRR